jgi:hypothetical protein
MTSTKYIGMDVHKESISIAVMNSLGKVVMECVIETKASTILQFIDGLRGDLHVTFEEGTWAAWLYDLLKPHVTEVVVCNPRKMALLKDGSKSDRIDARKLAEQLYMKKIKPVYHGEHGLRTLSHVLVQIDRRPGAHGSRQSFFSNRSTLFLFLRAELLLLTVPSGLRGSMLASTVAHGGIRSSTSSPRKNGSSTSSSFTKSTGSSSPHNLRYDLLRLSALRFFGNRVHHPLGQLAECKSGRHWSSTEQERLSICTVSSLSR